MPTNTPSMAKQIEDKALEILKRSPDGIRYTDLLKAVQLSIPSANYNHIRGTIWNLDAKKPKEVYKASKGLFRHTSFRDTLIGENAQVPALSRIKEEDFYQPFADWLVRELSECTKAIPLGGKFFEDKWGTPDVIGIERSLENDIIKHPIEIVSAEIKVDTQPQSLITAFGQACAYGAFSHKTYIVIPENSSKVDQDRLESLCLIFGIGLIFFDSQSNQDPDFRIRVRAIRHEPDMYYVNKNMREAPEELFK